MVPEKQVAGAQQLVEAEGDATGLAEWPSGRPQQPRSALAGAALWFLPSRCSLLQPQLCFCLTHLPCALLTQEINKPEGQMLWTMLIIPAARESEAGGSKGEGQSGSPNERRAKASHPCVTAHPLSWFFGGEEVKHLFFSFWASA